MKRVLFLISVMTVLVLSFQNCGEFDPSHSKNGVLASVGGDGILNDTYDGLDTTEIDSKIAALAVPALNAWNARCTNCHTANNSGGLSGSFDEFSLRVYNQNMYTKPSLSNGNSKINFNEANGPMPEQEALADGEGQALIDYINALLEKKDIIANDKISCYAQTEYSFEQDIFPFIQEDSIAFDNDTLNCLNCHGANSSIPLNSYNAVRNWVSPKKPDASVLLDALAPLDGSTAADYHQVEDSKIEMVENWIIGCAPTQANKQE